MRWLSEYLLKGVFWGLVVFVALQEADWWQLGQVALFTLVGLSVVLTIAGWQKVRQGYQVLGRLPAFILFLVLESSGLVYAGIILGLAIGAFSIRKPESENLFLISFAGGGALGLALYSLRLVVNRWHRFAMSLALAGALIAGAWYGFQESSILLQDQAARNQFAIVLLLGIPFFYLLTFAGSAEESEVDAAAMSAALGLSIVMLAWGERSYQSSGLLLTLVLYLWYTLRVLPSVRVFKHVVRGVSHANIGRYRPALEAFHQALKLDPQNSLVRESMGRMHRALNIDDVKQDQQTLALMDFDFCLDRVKSLLLAPGPTPAQLDEAHHLLDLVISQRPAYGPIVDYWRAVAYTHARRYEEAAAKLEGILANQASGAFEHAGTGVITDPARPGDPHRDAILFDAWQLALTLHPEMNRRVGTPQLATPGRRLEAIAAVECRLADAPDDQAGWELKRMLYSNLTPADYEAGAKPIPPDFDHDYVYQLGLALINDPARWRRGAEYLRIAANGLRSQAPSILLQVANAYQKAQDAAGVWDHYELAKQAGRAVGPQSLTDEARKVYFDIVKILGEDARSRDDIDAAIENYQLSSESDRSGLETLRILAELYEKKGEVFPALFTVEKALLYNPKDADLLEKKDRYYYSVLSDDLRARKEPSKGFDIGYCLKKARSLLDTRDADLDLIDWAQHLIELARVIQPDSITPKVLQARALRRRGEIDQSRAILEDVYSHKPEKFATSEDEDSWYLACRLLGEAYLNEMSRPDLAIPCFTEFRKSSKSGADTLYKLGQAYEQTGDRVRAKKCYEHVVSYDSHPLAPDAREALYRLQSG
jgi:tetratricopeptide (TPR) repeat protein